jgi:glycerophosphoryl diester phosphodiesterase
MRRRALLACLALVGTAACRTSDSTNDGMAVPRFDVQGHRGARALWPENTIPGFLGALDLGVSTLELDVVVSQDGVVVVSHEPWFSGRFSSTPAGYPIAAGDEREHPLYALPYAEIRRFDVGRRGNPEFPRQRAMPAFKPTLDEVFASAERHAHAVGRARPRYSVEIKSKPEWDGRLTPPVEEFTALVLATIDRADVSGRVTVQSFDVRALRAMRRAAPELPLALLVGGSEPRDVDRDVAELGFTPEVYSPAYPLVDAALVARCHALGMRVLPWTVNELRQMVDLVRLGVDGLITDSPDVALALRG